MTKSRGILASRRYWHESEINLLREMYPECAGDDVAAWLNRPLSAIYAAAKKYDVQKSEEFFASDTACRVRRGKQNANMIATRFQRGLTPWNKGVPGSAGHHPNSRRTQFAKGRRAEESRNYVPLGTHRLSKDGYLERKVTDDPSIVPARRWTPVARLVWEAAHGPIPAHHMIVFKEGRRTAVLEEITLERLECISRAENARRNHPRSRSLELAALVQLKGAITRQVNRIAREAAERTDS